MIRQEIVICEKCGVLKEIDEPCECSGEEKKEDDWKRSSVLEFFGL